MSCRVQVPGSVSGVLLADELGAMSESLEPGQGGLTIGAWVPPFLEDTVVVTVGDHGRPEPGDLLVVETDVVASDGASRNTGKNDPVGITAVATAQFGNGLLDVTNRRLWVVPGLLAPPTGCDPGAGVVDKWQADPDELLAARDSVAQLAPLGVPGADITKPVAVGAIAGQFDAHGVLTVTFPVGWQPGHMLEMGCFVSGEHFLDPLAGTGGAG